MPSLILLIKVSPAWRGGGQVGPDRTGKFFGVLFNVVILHTSYSSSSCSSSSSTSYPECVILTIDTRKGSYDGHDAFRRLCNSFTDRLVATAIRVRLQFRSFCFAWARESGTSGSPPYALRGGRPAVQKTNTGLLMTAKRPTLSCSPLKRLSITVSFVTWCRAGRS